MKQLKNLATIAISALLIASCSEREHNPELLTPVSVRVDGFYVGQEDLPRTRAATSLTSTSINALALAFYTADSTEQVKLIQHKNDPDITFGQFNCTLPYGTYTMVVVGYITKEGSPFEFSSLTEAAYTGQHAYETFCTTKSVTLNHSSPVGLTATLDRINTQLQVVSTDGRTAGITNVRMTMSAGNRSFSPVTGLALSDTEFSNTVGISASIDSTSKSNSLFFLTSDEQTMDVTIETLDAGGEVVFSQTVQNVPFKRNRITKMVGSIYSTSAASGPFLVNSYFLPESEVNF